MNCGHLCVEACDAEPIQWFFLHLELTVEGWVVGSFKIHQIDPEFPDSNFSQLRDGIESEPELWGQKVQLLFIFSLGAHLSRDLQTLWHNPPTAWRRRNPSGSHTGLSFESTSILREEIFKEGFLSWYLCRQKSTMCYICLARNGYLEILVLPRLVWPPSWQWQDFEVLSSGPLSPPSHSSIGGAAAGPPMALHDDWMEANIWHSAISVTPEK